MTLTEKIEAFRALLEADSLRAMIGSSVDCEGNRQGCKTRIKMGKKYCNVDRGSSGVYMVVLATGEIFSIKGYGVIHRGHQFGTLDTIHEWDWSGYRAVKKPPTTLAA